MARKPPPLIPFLAGSMQHYVYGGVPDWAPGKMPTSERERTNPHTGRPLHTFGIYDADEWRVAEPQELTLVLVDVDKGRSRLTTFWEDTKGLRWPMFFADFTTLVEERRMNKGPIWGKFMPSKRGDAYGLKIMDVA